MNLYNFYKSNIPVLIARNSLLNSNSLTNMSISLLVYSLRLEILETIINDFNAVATNKNIEGTLKLITIIELLNLYLMPYYKLVRYSICND